MQNICIWCYLTFIGILLLLLQLYQLGSRVVGAKAAANSCLCRVVDAHQIEKVLLLGMMFECRYSGENSYGGLREI